jgi:hypothetical protein
MGSLDGRVGKLEKRFGVHERELHVVIFVGGSNDNIAGYEYGGTRVVRSAGESVEQLQQRAQDTLLPLAARNHLGWRVLALSEIFYSELNTANA